MLLVFATLFLGMSQPVSSDKSVNRSNEEIRVLPVARAPESESVILRTVRPQENAVLSGNPVWIQFRIDGYALGADSSQFPRADEIAISDMGQTVHVIVDNRPYFSINEPEINPFNEEGYYRETSYKFEMPFNLREGMHTIRMFPARSFGESLKGENTFQASVFYLGHTSSRSDMNLSQPYLTYNEPSIHTELTEAKPILLDFLVTNCELTSDGYKVRLTIDGKINRVLTSWQPYYIYGLPQGKHTIHLELLDSHGKIVSGVFNSVEQQIVVH